jgi:hypothetical protein
MCNGAICVPPPNFGISFAATVDERGGLTICGAGQGFTIGGRVDLVYLNLPFGAPSPLDLATKIVDANGNIQFTDTKSQQGCTGGGTPPDVTVQATDLGTGAVARVVIQGVLFCIEDNVTNVNGGCP